MFENRERRAKSRRIHAEHVFQHLYILHSDQYHIIKPITYYLLSSRHLMSSHIINIPVQGYDSKHKRNGDNRGYTRRTPRTSPDYSTSIQCENRKYPARTVIGGIGKFSCGEGGGRGLGGVGAGHCSYVYEATLKFLRVHAHTLNPKP